MIETTATTSTSKKKNGGTNNLSIGPIGFSGNYSDVKALQIINIFRADTLYRKLETNIDFRINCCTNSWF